MSELPLSVIQIRENYFHTLERIAKAARIAGRAPEDIRLVVVTKTHPIEVVIAVVEAGAKYLGENYAEEAVLKIKELPAQYVVQWHMIGHIQSRKAALVCEYFDYVHSLDSLKLATRLDRFAGEHGRKLPVLVECNLGGEATKFGYPIWNEGLWKTILEEIAQIVELPNLSVRGVMGMAPFMAIAEEARPYYRRLRLFRDFLQSRLPRVDWRELSMGMSADFEVAVQEGATWVRIGQSILGARRTG